MNNSYDQPPIDSAHACGIKEANHTTISDTTCTLIALAIWLEALAIIILASVVLAVTNPELYGAFLAFRVLVHGV